MNIVKRCILGEWDIGECRSIFGSNDFSVPDTVVQIIFIHLLNLGISMRVFVPSLCLCLTQFFAS